MKIRLYPVHSRTVQGTVCLLFACALFSHAQPEIDYIKQIDQRLDATAPRLSDYAFARRAYTTIIGRIPTLAELNQFIAEPDRVKLVDQLFDSPARISHEYNWWADLLRLKDKVPGVSGSSTRAYQNWLRKALHDNRPYDEMVRQLVSASGYAGDNGAVGFYQRDRGMPLDHLANTAQTFLGTRLVCAQCHDHPFQDWTQMDFFRLAAFSAPMEVHSLPMRYINDLPNIEAHLTQREKVIKEVGFAAITRPFRNSLVEDTGKPLKLPHDYQYNDAKPKDIVEPLTPFGDVVELKSGEQGSVAYANWMTSPANPRFSRVIANRIWKKIMGLGLVEPVDDLDAGRTTGNSKLLDRLENMIRELDYDLIAFQKILCKTKLFQCESIPFELSSGKKYSFSGPVHRRMTAEQIWDSIGILLRDDLDETISLHHTGRTDPIERNAWKSIENSDVLTLLKRTREIDAFMDAAAERTATFREELSELVAKQNENEADAWLERVIKMTEADLARYTELAGLGEGPDPARYLGNAILNIRQQMVQAELRSFPKLKPRYVEYFFSYHTASIASRELKQKRKAIEAEYQQRLKAQGPKVANPFRYAAHNRLRLSGFTRASETGNPSPTSHFLRELGQSDRDLINNANRETTIPQLLEFRNGNLAEYLNNKESSLWVNLRELNDVEQIINSLFLQMLARPATDTEKTLLKPEFQTSQEAGIRTTIFALLNTSEFVFLP